MMTKNEQDTDDAEEVIGRAFQVFDKNGDGFVSTEKLRYVLRNLGEEATDEEIDEMMREADTNDDGHVNWKGTQMPFPVYIIYIS